MIAKEAQSLRYDFFPVTLLVIKVGGEQGLH